MFGPWMIYFLCTFWIGNHLVEEERAGCFTLCSCLLLCGCYLSVLVLSSFAIILLGKRELHALHLFNYCFYVHIFICFLMSLPHGVMDWSISMIMTFPGLTPLFYPQI